MLVIILFRFKQQPLSTPLAYSLSSSCTRLLKKNLLWTRNIFFSVKLKRKAHFVFFFVFWKKYYFAIPFSYDFTNDVNLYQSVRFAAFGGVLYKAADVSYYKYNQLGNEIDKLVILGQVLGVVSCLWAVQWPFIN